MRRLYAIGLAVLLFQLSTAQFRKVWQMNSPTYPAPSLVRPFYGGQTLMLLGGNGTWLRLVDGAGGTVWQSAAAGKPAGLAVTPPGDIAVLTQLDTLPVGRKIASLFLFDSAGTKRWEYDCDGADVQTIDPLILACDQAGDCFFCGNLTLTDGTSKALIAAVDSAGNALWSIKFDRPHGLWELNNIFVDKQGDVVATGYVFDTEFRLWAVKASKSGSLLWQAESDVHGLDSSESPSPSAALLGSDRLVVGCGTKTGAFLYAFNTDGSKAWSLLIPSGNTDPSQSVTALVRDNTDEIYLASNVYSGGDGFGRGYFRGIDSSGAVLWTRQADPNYYAARLLVPRDAGVGFATQYVEYVHNGELQHYYSSFGVLNSDGSVAWHSGSGDSCSPVDLCWSKSGGLVFTGSIRDSSGHWYGWTAIACKEVVTTLPWSVRVTEGRQFDGTVESLFDIDGAFLGAGTRLPGGNGNPSVVTVEVAAHSYAGLPSFIELAVNAEVIRGADNYIELRLFNWRLGQFTTPEFSGRMLGRTFKLQIGTGIQDFVSADGNIVAQVRMTDKTGRPFSVLMDQVQFTVSG